MTNIHGAVQLGGTPTVTAQSRLGRIGHLFDDYDRIVEDALKAKAFGESVQYQLSLTLLPTDPPVSALAVLVSIPSPILGERLVQVSMLPTVSPTRELLTAAAQQTFDAVAERRRALLSPE